MDLLNAAMRALAPPSPPPAAPPPPPPPPEPGERRQSLRGYVPLHRVRASVWEARAARQQGDLSSRAQMLHHDQTIAKRVDDCMINPELGDKRGRGAFWKQWTTSQCLRSAYGDVDKAVRTAASSCKASHTTIRENRASIAKVFSDGQAAAVK